MKTWLVISIIFLSAATLMGRTINVPGDSATLQAGIDGALDGDTVLVAAGVYSGSGFNWNSIYRSIVVLAENDDVTLKSYWGRGFVIYSGSVTIEGFSIDSAHFGIWQMGTVTLNRCKITRSEFGIYVKQGTMKATDCELGYNGYSVFGTEYPQLRVEIELTRTVIHHGRFAPTVTLQSGSHVRLSSCTIANNAGDLCWLPGSIAEMTKCAIAFNSGVGVGEFVPTPHCNNSFGNSVDYPTGFSYFAGDEFGNVSVNPQFCDTANADYHITTTSPCAPANNSCGVLIGALPPMCGWTCHDTDGDGYGDPGYPGDACPLDNCPSLFNLNQWDTDGNGVGDACEPCLCGDADGTGYYNIADVVYIINWMFSGGPPPNCELDADGNGFVSAADLVYLITFIFSSGPPPHCP